MIAKLLDEIAAYFTYLKNQHDDYVAFHNFRIPLDNYMVRLAPHNINSNPYCMYAKSNPDVWKHCIARQGKVVEKCADGIFCGVCYAGMGEVVVPIQDTDGTVLGFISVSGYRIQPQTAKQKIRHFAQKYQMDCEQLLRIYDASTRPAPADLEELKARISPLCSMFVLLYHELQGVYAQGIESQRQSCLLSHAIIYIHKNYTNNIQMADIASYCHCSVSTLSHLFKKETGVSISEFLGKLRTERGKVLLKDTELTVSQISDALGFCNANYFCRIFKENVGCSPSAYRKENRVGKEEVYNEIV